MPSKYGPLKYGDTRGDGFRFLCYQVERRPHREVGKANEAWLSPSVWLALDKKKKETRRKNHKKNRAADREKTRVWVKQNPEWVRENKRAHYQKNRERIRAYHRERDSRPDVKEYHRRRSREYAARNTQSRSAYSKRWMTVPKNREKRNARQRARAKLNPETVAYKRSMRRARERGATPPLSRPQRQVIAALYAASRRVSKCLGVQFHVDHIVPLSKGGAHTPENLQILPASVNLRKGAKICLPTDLHALTV